MGVPERRPIRPNSTRSGPVPRSRNRADHRCGRKRQPL